MSMLTRRGLLGALAGAALCSAAPRALARTKPSSILYISSDEHNPGYLGSAGHPFARTPNLDRFFAQSLELRGVHTSSPVCAPTRQSWLTGLLPMEHGQLGNAYVFDDDATSLVTGLEGYDTACFGKLHTNAEERDGRFGFQRLLSTKSPDWDATLKRYRVGSDGGAYDPQDAAILRSLPPPVAHKFLGKVRGSVQGSADWVLLQEALGWLQERSPERPFFCYVSFRFPHYPFDLPEDFYYAFKPAELDEPPPIEHDWSSRLGGAYQMRKRGWQSLTREQTQLLRARYLGAVSYLDWLVGQLLDNLAAMGLAEDTLVVYSSDHGDMGGNKGLWLKDVMYDDVTRKPTAIRLPGRLPAGTRSSELMGDIDLLPTVFGLAGAPLRRPLTGADRSAALLNGHTEAEATFAYDFINPDSGPQMSMVRSRGWKFVHYEGSFFPKGGAELYKLDEDPGETRNLAADPGYAGVADELLGLLRQRRVGLRAPAKVEKKEDTEGD